MLAFHPVVLAAAVVGVFAAATCLSVAVVASLRGGRSTAAARRLAPLTVTPAIAAFLLSSLALADLVPSVAPLAGVLVVTGGLVVPVRNLWRTTPEPTETRAAPHPAD